MNVNFRLSKRRITLAASLLSMCSAVALAQTDVLTYHNDNLRTGQNTSESILKHSNVNQTSFGKLFTIPADGKVDAQPLYTSFLNIPGKGAHNVVFVATEHDTVYANDADSGTPYWQVSLLQPGETSSDARGCDQVIPEIGITATPVIDRTAGPHGTIYLIAMTKDAFGKYHHRLHALDITTGAEQFGGPTEVVATYPGTGDNSSGGQVVFDPAQYKDRPGLLLLNGIVYTSWASHCDIRPYTGWTIGYDRLTLRQTSIFNFAPNGNEAAIWASNGAPSADLQGNLYFAVANGTFDTTLNAQGFPSQGNYGNAFVKLALQNGKLTPIDYWTMDNTINESNTDTDLGSGGIMLLPDLIDATGKARHLGVGAGKDGNLYVIDRDNMGKFDSVSNATIYQELGNALPGGIWGNPAYFNNTVFFGPVGSNLFSFPISQARLSAGSSSQHQFVYPGVTPAISANGINDGIVWVVESTTPAILRAYDATNLGNELFNSTQAPSNRDQLAEGNKYITPTIANGKVFVPTANSVSVFGLLNQGFQPIPDGNYILTNAASNLVLDDPAASRTPGQQIIEWPINHRPNQYWHFAFQGNGAYTIQNLSSGLFLTDPNGSKVLATALEQQTPTNDSSQLWSLTPSGTSYVIRNQASGLVIDDPRGTAVFGTGIIVWAPNNRINQNWAIN